MTRAIPRQLRKGRERCSAHRKDGQPCQAPAIEGGTVCRVHGGGAPQVRIAARRMVLLERLDATRQAWEAVHEGRAPGQLVGRREADAMGRIAIAERALEQHDQDVKLIQLMRAELAAADRDPAAVRQLLELARARLSHDAAPIGPHP